MHSYKTLCHLSITDFAQACGGTYMSKTSHEHVPSDGYARVGMSTHPTIRSLTGLSRDYEAFAGHRGRLHDLETSRFFGSVAVGLLTIATTITRNMLELKQKTLSISRTGVVYAPAESEVWEFPADHIMSTWANTLAFEIMAKNRKHEDEEPVITTGNSFTLKPANSQVHAIYELMGAVKAGCGEDRTILNLLTPLLLHTILAAENLPEEYIVASIGYNGEVITGRIG